MTTTEKTKTKHLSDLHFEHKLWTMEAEFYLGELNLYQSWLDEIAAKNTGEEVAKQVEHFQNQFIIQRSQLQLLRHQITAHENWLANHAETHFVAIDHQSFADHTVMRQNAETFKKLYTELKADFKRFVSDWM